MNDKTEHPYNVIIGRHMQVSPALEDYITKKLHKVEKLSHNIIDIHVTFDTTKVENSVTILMHFGHDIVKVHASSDDMYTAIDRATDKLTHLLHRYKDKLTNHHIKGHKEINMELAVYAEPTDLDIINQEIEAENAREEKERYILHRIVRKENKPLKMLTSGEAIVKMELSSEPFMLFKGEEDQKLKLIYRMPDNNYGIITPE